MGTAEARLELAGVRYLWWPRALTQRMAGRMRETGVRTEHGGAWKQIEEVDR